MRAAALGQCPARFHIAKMRGKDQFAHRPVDIQHRFRARRKRHLLAQPEFAAPAGNLIQHRAAETQEMAIAVQALIIVDLLFVPLLLRRVDPLL